MQRVTKQTHPVDNRRGRKVHTGSWTPEDRIEAKRRGGVSLRKMVGYADEKWLTVIYYMFVS